MSSQKIPRALPVSINLEEAKFLPMVNQARLAAGALMKFEYENRMDKDGNWVKNGETKRSLQKPSAITGGRNAQLKKMWANSKVRGGLHETSLDEVFNDPAFSSVYGAREVRLVATLAEDEVEVLDTNGLKRIQFVLSVNDYNKRTIVYPLKGLEEEAEEAGQKKSRKKKKKKKGASNSNGEVEQVDQNHLILQH